MSDGEVESRHAAAAEPIPVEISCEKMQSATKIRIRKNNDHESNQVSHCFEGGEIRIRYSAHRLHCG